MYILVTPISYTSSLDVGNIKTDVIYTTLCANDIKNRVLDYDRISSIADKVREIYIDKIAALTYGATVDAENSHKLTKEQPHWFIINTENILTADLDNMILCRQVID